MSGLGPATGSERLRQIMRATLNVALAMILATTFALILTVVAVLTLFQARRFYAEFCARHFARLILWLGHTRYRVYGAPTATPCFYMPNHPSTLDPFIYMALGLPNTRFFMSWSVPRRFPPIGVIAAIIGVFLTPEQHDTPGRIRLFQRAYRHLARSRESVLGTAEGKIVPNAEVGPFNRGVFHLATLLQYPIQPLFLAFPPGTSAGRGYVPGSGEAGVYFLPTITTKGWQLEDLEANKERVREVFVLFGRRLAEIGGPGAWAELKAGIGE